ncbi:DUF4214 domain-containing protein [bacterium]|jgi:hypothetical protein|nr:DUF4214 domain-containing protein [bacterium]
MRILTILVFILLSGTSNSAEENSNEEYIKQVYQTYLKRDPDPSGMQSYGKALADGWLTRDQMVQDVLNSEEYQSRFGSREEAVENLSAQQGPQDPKEYVNWAFQVTMGRAPSRRESLRNSTKIGLGLLSREELLENLKKSSPGFKQGTSPGTPNSGGFSPGTGNSGGEAGSTSGEYGSDPSVTQSKSKDSALPGHSAGWVSMETSGIRHRSDPSPNGDWEYIFLTLRGEGFHRILLLHAGGNGRAIRYVVEGGGTKAMRMEIASDNLPDWHTWKVQWTGSEVKIFLDGNQIGRTEKFSGKPNRVWAGGYPCCGGKRNFLGKWRNLKFGSL